VIVTSCHALCFASMLSSDLISLIGGERIESLTTRLSSTAALVLAVRAPERSLDALVDARLRALIDLRGRARLLDDSS